MQVLDDHQHRLLRSLPQHRARSLATHHCGNAPCSRYHLLVVHTTSLERDPVLAKIVERLVKTYHPERIYLFGAKARGDSGQDSDYDLLIVVADDAPIGYRRSRRAYEALRGTGTATDVLVWTHTQFESRLHLRASLPATVIGEGKLVHAA